MMGAVTWLDALAVACGAGAGALARWASGLALNQLWSGFPLGTLLVNCAGGLLIGLAMVWFARSPHEVVRLLLVTGFLGGFTTFSSFSAESLGLLQRGDWGLATAHTLSHVLGALAFTAAGFAMGRALWMRG